MLDLLLVGVCLVGFLFGFVSFVVLGFMGLLC